MITPLWSLVLGWVMSTYDQYNALAGVGLSQGYAKAVSLATGASQTMQADVQNWDVLTVNADLTGTAAGDLTIQVFPVAPDGSSIEGTPLPAVTGVGFAPALQAGHVQAVQQFNVQGLDKVNVVIKNNNAATQTLNATWRTEDA